MIILYAVNPSTPRPEGLGLPSTRDFGELSRVAQAEGSGLILSGVWRSRMYQLPDVSQETHYKIEVVIQMMLSSTGSARQEEYGREMNG